MDLDDFDFVCNDSVANNSNDVTSTLIEIHVKQRNGRKCITTVEGLGNDKDKLKSISKTLGKKLCCSASVKKDDDGNLFIKFQGKDIKTIRDHLISEGYEEKDIRVHGLSA